MKTKKMYEVVTKGASYKTHYEKVANRWANQIASQLHRPMVLIKIVR